MIKYRRFEVDANNTRGTPTQSTHISSPQMYSGLRATAQDPLPISNGQNPQLSPEHSFLPGLGRPGPASDWLQQDISAANSDSLIFSSSSQSHNPSQNHYPHSAAQPRLTAYDVPQQPYEGGDGDCQHGPSYSEDQSSTQLFENHFPNIPVTHSYDSLDQPHAYAFGQAGSGTLSGHSSNGSTPTAARSGVKDIVPDMFNSANDAHQVLYSVGSSGFHLDMQPSPSLETSNGYHSPGTDSSSFTLPYYEPTDNLVSSTVASRSRRFTTSHHVTFDNTAQHLPLRRSSSTRPSNRYSPIAQPPLQPKPEKKVAAEGTQRNGFFGHEVHIPRKGRGRRTKPLEEGKRKNATKRRNERTVCIGCKLAKVMVSPICTLLLYLST
jgi:hypothetical protein